MDNGLKMNAAIDLGNGLMKININGKEYIEPSNIAILRQQDIKKGTSFNSKAEEEVYMKELLDNLEISIQSSNVKESGRFLAGKAAVKSGLTTQGYNVHSPKGKAQDDLSLILVLSYIAGKAVQEFYANEKELPVDLEMTVNLVTALPIEEGKNVDRLEQYKEKYVGTTHNVTIYNFSPVISVKIIFSDVIVALEGEAAQYALKHGSKNLIEAVEKDFKQYYPELAKEVSGNDLVSADNIIGIDIGEGTVDFPVFVNGKLNTTASHNIKKGYGHALEESMEELSTNGLNFDSRDKLSKYLQTPITPLSKGRIEFAQAAVNNQLAIFARAIVDGLFKSISKNDNNVDVVFVYGGGATPMEDNLREKLKENLSGFLTGTDIPIVFVNKEYSQKLNEFGLKIILDTVTNMEK